MQKSKKFALIQIIGLVVFSGMALSSASSQGTSSNIDWRGAAVGGGAAYLGYDYIGNTQSEAEAYKLAEKKGYSEYLWDSKNGNVYAK